MLRLSATFNKKQNKYKTLQAINDSFCEKTKLAFSGVYAVLLKKDFCNILFDIKHFKGTIFNDTSV